MGSMGIKAFLTSEQIPMVTLSELPARATKAVSSP